MFNRRNVVVSIALISSFGLAVGCHGKKSKVKDHREKTEVAVIQTEPGPPPGTVIINEPPPVREVVIVREAPPPLIIETRPPPPAVGLVWVDGYWVHDRGHFVWCRGRYIEPVPGCRHEPAHWEHTRHGWEFHGERWVRH